MDYLIYSYRDDTPVKRRITGQRGRLPYRPRYNIDTRHEEFKGFLENEKYAEQHENIRDAIAIYDLGVMPYVLHTVNLQGGRPVPLEDFTHRITDRRP